IRPCADRNVEMLAELSMVIADPRHRLADRARNARPRTFRRRGRTAITSAQSHRPREFSHDEVAFCLRLCGALEVPIGLGVSDVVLDFLETSAIGALRAIVEDLARIAERRASRLGHPYGRYPGPGLGFGGG